MPLEMAPWPEILPNGTDSIRTRVRALLSRNCITAVGVDATNV
jgi:hypothetical protein